MERDTSERVLLALKTHGGQTAQQLASGFGLTVMAVRKQVHRLIEEGLVTYRDERSGRGRPRRIYRLAAAGHARFPDRHGALTAELLAGVRDLFGEEGLDRLIASRERSQRAAYRARLGDAPELSAKLARLAEARSDEGYMARSEARPDGTYLLIEDHCPICVAARECQGFCRSELAIFRKLLDDLAEVERVDHIFAGARRCAYRVTPKADRDIAG